MMGDPWENGPPIIKGSIPETKLGQLFDLRSEIGNRCIALASGAYEVKNPETAATAAISDILTALYGPAGAWTSGRLVSYDHAIDEAWSLLDQAYRAYRGDAEDYFVEPPEPPEPSKSNWRETAVNAIDFRLYALSTNGDEWALVEALKDARAELTQ